MDTKSKFPHAVISAMPEFEESYEMLAWLIKQPDFAMWLTAYIDSSKAVHDPLSSGRPRIDEDRFYSVVHREAPYKELAKSQSHLIKAMRSCSVVSSTTAIRILKSLESAGLISVLPREFPWSAKLYYCATQNEQAEDFS